jgi:peptidoglycan/LPS O-acetylase OafA/YrhL
MNEKNSRKAFAVAVLISMALAVAVRYSTFPELSATWRSFLTITLMAPSLIVGLIAAYIGSFTFPKIGLAAKLLGVFSVILSILRLTSICDIPWMWVLSPIWIPTVIIGLVAVALVLFNRDNKNGNDASDHI